MIFNIFERHIFGYILSKQSVLVFIQSSLPWRIRVAEEYFKRLQIISQVFMTGKFFSIVNSKSFNPGMMITQKKVNRILNLICTSFLDLTTTAVTEISYTTATSGGNVTNEGGAPILSKGICWNTSENPTIDNSKTLDGTGTGPFTSILSQLVPSTKYYVRAYATNNAGTGYGNQVSFTSNTILLATLTTTAISSTNSLSAVSGGNITADGGGTVTARGVCWATTTIPTINNNKTTDGSGTGSFTSNLTNLTANTSYYVRAYATNSAGTAYGEQIQFITLVDYTGQ